MTDKEDRRTYLLKEIDIVQDVINRTAHNSFLIKGWTVTLVVATLLLKGSNTQVVLAYIPLLVFWFLDAYFLWQEKMYRELYKWVIENRLKTDEYLLDMNAYRFRDKVPAIPRIMFSITLGWFYGSVAVLIVIYSIILLIQKAIAIWSVIL